ncbi:hypothetical protein [Stutzerimonas balearica]|uniref:Uncharacterized protein n=2 Tax=Stutzerimonas balearica DSM 6083 TaxID=1123016 RepID=A0A8D3XZX5_9GAMM|nr:hypothetical protein [Stutzerimonas balearica]AJE14703.1 hypothetical protein CL52_06465 [Stutzerimonas balearica DSM 6083]
MPGTRGGPMRPSARPVPQALLIASLAGALIWALSPWASGQAEPWDGDGLYYSGALFTAGVLAGFIVPRPLWAQYLGVIVGQVLYLLLFLPIGPLLAVGLVFLLLWSLLFLAGAYAGARLRTR